jgi:5-methyltetrahydropteroyltriglutamate--homocysteine methyltransferase
MQHSGFSPRPGRDPLAGFRAEIDSFPEYYEQYLAGAMTGGMAAPAVPLACTGPVSYTGHDRLARDLELLRAAAGDVGPDQVFACAVAPSGVGGNEYYPTEAAYLDAVADALHEEIHPQIVWAKLESLAEGARRATARLWR